MLNLIEKISIHDTGNSASYAVFVNVMEGIDGSATFGLQTERSALLVNEKQTQQYKQTWTFDLRVIDESLETSKLNAIVASGNTANISMQTKEGFAYMDFVRLTYAKQYDGFLALAIQATKEARFGYNLSIQGAKFPRNSSPVPTKYEPVGVLQGWLNKWDTNFSNGSTYTGGNGEFPSYLSYYADITSNTWQSSIINASANHWRLEGDQTTNEPYQQTVYSPNFHAPYESQMVITMRLFDVGVTGNSHYDATVLVRCNSVISNSTSWTGIGVPSTASAGRYKRTINIPEGCDRIEIGVRPASNYRRLVSSAGDHDHPNYVILGNATFSYIEFGEINLYKVGYEPDEYQGLSTTLPDFDSTDPGTDNPDLT
jgi:hypothetical protein